MKRLLEIQKELKAPKNQYNEFGGFKYRTCEDILNAVKPLLAKNDLVLLLTDEIVSLDGRFYVKATALLVDNDRNTVASVDAYAREPEHKTKMDDAQLTGSSSSYARKYALNGLFCIDDVQDADSQNNTEIKENKLKEEPNPDEQLIFSILKNQDSLSSLTKYYGENKNKVTDRASFNKLYTETAKKLKEEIKNANNQ